jgi:CDP-glucose 4,6-dehydratase
MIAAAQYEDISYAGYYNVGPDEVDCFKTGNLVDLFCNTWGEGMKWINRYDGGPHEANFLKLDCSKLKSVFGWTPCWNLGDAVKYTIEWTKCLRDGGDVEKCMDEQLGAFVKSAKWIEK